MVFVDTFYHKLKSVTKEIIKRYLDMMLNVPKKNKSLKSNFYVDIKARLFIKIVLLSLSLTMMISGAESKIGKKINDIISSNTNINLPIPNLPSINIVYDANKLTCYPIKLIKKKFHKDRVQYYCIDSDIKLSKSEFVDDIDREHGQIDTERLINDVKEKVDQGNKYKVDILLSDATSGRWVGFFLKRELKEKSQLSKIIDEFLPTKYYLSLRPQLANNGDQKGLKCRDGGSRGGFFYYREFENDIEIMFQYEAGIDFNGDVPFINITNGDNSTRRLSYISLMYGDFSIVFGKYWSVYYDIAGFTDYYMAFGVQASGAFNNSSDGSNSGTGRPDRVVQLKTTQDIYNVSLQFQPTHPSSEDIDSDYSYGIAGSTIYKYSDFLRVGASISYVKFNDITQAMNSIGIDGDDQAYIVGFIYKRERYSINSTFSYTKNHMNDDRGYYLDTMGAELYLRYDISDMVRLVGGGNWMIPANDDYQGEYRVRTNIISLQYTFGTKNFDDLIYIELSAPRGRLANGDELDISLAIGLRYLFSR